MDMDINVPDRQTDRHMYMDVDMDTDISLHDYGRRMKQDFLLSSVSAYCELEALTSGMLLFSSNFIIGA